MPDRICVIPKVNGVGGMVSFLHKFTAGATARGVEVTNDLRDEPYSALMVIGGSRNIQDIYRLSRRGVRIVQRLDGINWIQRVRPVSLKHSLRAEYGNFILALIRRHLAQKIVYQSKFSQWWWEKQYGILHKPASVIYNGVDLAAYSPAGDHPGAPYRLLVVEGSLGGGYENGLENAIHLAEGLAERGLPMEVQVVGEVHTDLRAVWSGRSKVPLVWSGLVRREEIAAIDRAAHLFFSADIHPACPNSVIEALACGLPVVSFDTGSLSELVTPETGFIAPYGSNSWKLETPNIEGLVVGSEQVLRDWKKYSLAARARAERMFGLEQMVDRYLEVLLG